MWTRGVLVGLLLLTAGCFEDVEVLPKAPVLFAVASPTTVAVQKLKGTRPANTAVLLNDQVVAAAAEDTSFGFDVVLQPPDVKWFNGGRLNITENCLDRHLAARGDKTAILWEPNDPQEAPQRISYRELHERVCRYANVLKRNGVKKGDRVCVYMPMIPELAVAVLACARIGAIHSVVFAGFSAQSIADRIQDADAAFVLTSDGIARGAKKGPVKAIVDEALKNCPGVRRVIVAQRTGDAVTMTAGRDGWLHEELAHVDDLSRRSDGQRGHALHPLHEREHRQTQGRGAHLRRVHGVC